MKLKINPEKLRECRLCGSVFEYRDPQQVFCSAICRNKAYFGEKKQYKVKCPICRVRFITNKQNKKYCSRECADKANKRRYREKPSAANWFSICEYVNERDKYKCVECGSCKNLHVHHIKFLCNGGSNDFDNLVTLCSQCHAKKHSVSA